LTRGIRINQCGRQKITGKRGKEELSQEKVSLDDEPRNVPSRAARAAGQGKGSVEKNNDQTTIYDDRIF